MKIQYRYREIGKTDTRFGTTAIGEFPVSDFGWILFLLTRTSIAAKYRKLIANVVESDGHIASIKTQYPHNRINIIINVFKYPIS